MTELCTDFKRVLAIGSWTEIESSGSWFGSWIGASTRLIRCAADCSVWVIKACEDIDESYVDDLLITGTGKEPQGLLKAIQATWACSPEQALEHGSCGLAWTTTPKPNA